MTKNYFGVCASSPARIDFTGGLTDVAPYVNKHTSVQVNQAISIRTSVSINPSDQNYITFPEMPDSSLKLVKLAVDLSGCRGMGGTLKVESNIGTGIGLGSSGSFTVSLVAALLSFARQSDSFNLFEIVTLACEIEKKAGFIAGSQDQLAAAYGGLNKLDFSKDYFFVSRLPCSQLDWFNRCLVLHEGGSRSSSKIVRQSIKSKVRLLKILNKLAKKTVTIFEKGNHSDLADIINYIRLVQLDICPGFVSPRMHQIIVELLELGEIGIKPVGAGGQGGCLLVNTRQARKVFYIAQAHGFKVLDIMPESKGLKVHLLK
jgi:D-glycero-alpha-D-manno-heptose-7-phosphate kinase